jgi:hypothetical protein
MANCINLIERWAHETQPNEGAALQLVRLDANETVLVPFTSDAAEAQIHYCEEPEIRGYVLCNGADCALCRAGRKAEGRMLLPVYLPAGEAVGVLPVSGSVRPGSLRPQLLPVLRSGKPMALLVSKPDRAKFTVSSRELTEGMDDGAQVIAAFRTRFEAGEVDLTAVYPRLDNAILAEVPGVAKMLRFKGVNVHGDD